MFKSGFEKNAFVIAFRRAYEFFHVGRADKFSRERISERRPSRLHQPNELPLRSIHPEILRFELECFLVIAISEKLEPMDSGGSRFIFIGALFGA